MTWYKAIALLFVSVMFSLSAKATKDIYPEPCLNKKDTLKVETQIKFNPLMLFSLPKAIDPVDHKGTTEEKKKDEHIGAI
ncbi:MAG: hypothetical protein HKN79_01140 [Flavobacteriales bacterium]|nr:hypothetical protein [Flavobacteriales bacterium]